MVLQLTVMVVMAEKVPRINLPTLSLGVTYLHSHCAWGVLLISGGAPTLSYRTLMSSCASINFHYGLLKMHTITQYCLLGSTIKNGHREQSEPGSIYEVAIGISGSLLVPSLGPRR